MDTPKQEIVLVVCPPQANDTATPRRQCSGAFEPPPHIIISAIHISLESWAIFFAWEYDKPIPFKYIKIIPDIQ